MHYLPPKGVATGSRCQRNLLSTGMTWECLATGTIIGFYPRTGEGAAGWRFVCCVGPVNCANSQLRELAIQDHVNLRRAGLARSSVRHKDWLPRVVHHYTPTSRCTVFSIAHI